VPYEGEFASYRPLHRITETERVRQLLGRARVLPPHPEAAARPVAAPPAPHPLPDFVIAIDGSHAEVDVRNGYPGAKVGYCTVASVLLNLREMDQLDQARPVDPKAFRQTEQSATIDAALPGANVVLRTHTSARDSFREALYEVFHDVVVDEDDRAPLLDTFHVLLELKPNANPLACPNSREGCERHFNPPPGLSSCPCHLRRAVYSTDALRSHERFNDSASNGEAFGEIMQVWERVLLVHLLRCFERRGWLGDLHRIGFLLDGPLAVFGHPAWLSASIETELKRLNSIAEAASGRQLLILGIEKSGAFVDHFAELDRTESGEPRFAPRSCLLLSDHYIKNRIIFSDSAKRYGLDTYFGRKFFYKTKSGALVVASMPFLNDQQDSLATEDTTPYPELGALCIMLDKLVSTRFPNALAPIVAAHAQAAIPLQLGAKVLQQLAKALMEGRR
jgi:hypothetical protein